MTSVFILHVSGGTYSLKSIMYDRFLRNYSFQLNFLLEFSAEICWERKAPQKYVFIFRFDGDVRFEPWRKSTHYLLDYGD